MSKLLTLVEHDAQEQTVTVELFNQHYVIRYYLDDDGDKCLLHNNGYCDGTSNLIIDYPDNDNYASDEELMDILATTPQLA